MLLLLLFLTSSFHFSANLATTAALVWRACVPSLQHKILDVKRIMASIIENTQEFVRSALEGNDASHDYAHIERVYNIAMNIAAREAW